MASHPTDGKSRRHRRARQLSALAAILLTGCGSQSPPSESPASVSPSPTPSVVTDPLASPTVQDVFAIGSDNRRLALTCWGTGTPVVVLDAGSMDPGIDRWKASDMVRTLARGTTVCAYDRAGLGGSDPAPNKPRVLDDVAGDLHLLLAAAHIPVPVVMVGASGGGFDVYQHAGRFPADVAGLVMLDVPAGQRAMSHADGPPEWSSADNPEHVDYYAEEHQMAVARLPIGRIPVTVVTASSGQSEDPATQRVWLEGSSRPVQVVLPGGHGIAFDAPDAVAKEILAVIQAIGH
jgi:alpha/beta hydrolase fold